MVPTSSSASPDLTRRLGDDLERAQAQLAKLEAEYAELLGDPGVIQEDRDGTRVLLEAARQGADEAARAMARFESGGYGVCVVCADPIGAERLEAVPEATKCVACQER